MTNDQRRIPLYIREPARYPETPLVAEPAFWLALLIAVVGAVWIVF